MKKIAAIIAFALVGCASQPSKEWAELNRFAAETRPLAGTEVKWSAYYDGIYTRMLAAGAPADQLALADEAIRSARDFESGTISATEFDDRRRGFQIRQTRLNGIESERQRVARAEAQSIGAAQMAAAAQMLQASAPPPVIPPPVAGAPTGIIRGMLQSQSASGQLRYCRYSNGVVTTVSTVELCPLSTQ